MGFQHSGTIVIGTTGDASYVAASNVKGTISIPVDKKDLKKYLHSRVDFDNATINSLFNIIQTDIDFYSMAIGIDVQKLLRGMLDIWEMTPDIGLPMSRVQFDRVLESDHLPDSHDFTNFISVCGRDDQGEDEYALSLSPLADFVGLPLFLNQEVILETSCYTCTEEHEHDIGKCGRFVHEEIECGKTEYTFIEVLRAIFLELTIYGYPGSPEKKQVIKEIEEDLKAFEEEHEDDVFGESEEDEEL